MDTATVVASQPTQTADTGAPAVATVPGTGAESVLTPSGGVDLTNKPPATETPGEKSGNEQIQQVPEQANEWQVKYQNVEEKTRRIQSERDKSEAFTRKILENITPWFDVDPYGNLAPRIQQPQQPSREQEMQQVIDLALLGDRNAFMTYGQALKEEAKQEALTEFNKQLQIKDAIDTEEQAIKKDYPALLDKEGNFDYNSPLYKEAERIVQQEFKGEFNVFNPAHLRAVIEMAENRRMKTSLPEIQKNIQNQVMTKASQTGAQVTGVPASGVDAQDPITSNLSQDQLASLRKEGVSSSEDLTRIANMIKKAKERGGYYL